jgi:hypothetical protein
MTGDGIHSKASDAGTSIFGWSYPLSKNFNAFKSHRTAPILSSNQLRTSTQRIDFNVKNHSALANCKETSNKRKITNILRKKAYKSRQISSQLQTTLTNFHRALAFLTFSKPILPSQKRVL